MSENNILKNELFSWTTDKNDESDFTVSLNSLAEASQFVYQALIYNELNHQIDGFYAKKLGGKVLVTLTKIKNVYYRHFFEVKNIENRIYLVIITSYELTGYYWNNLKERLHKLRANDSTIYFDFLFRNGENNRFFVSHTDRDAKLENDIKSYSGDYTQILAKLTDKFFKKEYKKLFNQ